MKEAYWLPITAAAGWIFVFAGSALAQEEKCVTVVGDESSGEKQSADPADMWSGDDALIVWPNYNRLLNTDDNFNFIPELAESWSISDDGKTWTFNLRKGVKFQDGSDFDAADVVYTFKRLIDPAVGSGAAPLLSFLKPEGLKAVDAHTVQFVTDQPVVELPQLITNKFTHIVPEGATKEQLRLKGGGTGPFIIEKFTPGGPVRILRRNPNYWRGPVAAECIRIIQIQEAASAMAAIKSGEADVLLSVAPAIISTLKDDPDVTLKATGASTSMLLSMWVDTPPFDNPKVREAMRLVVDRQQMVDTVLLGFGEPGNDNPVPLASPAAFEKQPRQRDVAKAKALLAEAGYSDGLKVDLHTSEGVAGMVAFAQAYAQMAKEGGIDVNLIQTPAESYWDDTWLKKPFLTSAWTMRSPAEGLAIAYTSDAKWNESHWFRPDYDAILKEANVTIDDAARTALYQKAQRMLADEGGVILPVFIHRVAALRKGCTGYTPHVQNQNLNFEQLTCE